MGCGKIENQILGTLFLTLIIAAALISYITDFVYVGEMYGTQHWKEFSTKYKGIVASLLTFNAVLILISFIAMLCLWKSTKIRSLTFILLTILILAILDGLAGAKLNSNEENKFATEWDSANNHPEYLKAWKASFAIDIFQMWIYSLGILFCIGSAIGIQYGNFDKFDQNDKLLQDEQLSIRYDEENKNNN